MLDDQLNVAEEECRSYKEFLEQLESGKLDTDTGEDYDKTIAEVSIHYRVRGSLPTLVGPMIIKYWLLDTA